MKNIILASILILSLSSGSALASRGDIKTFLPTAKTTAVSPARQKIKYKVEIVRSMGPVVEFAVSCNSQKFDSTVFYASYSPIGKSFCDAKLRCSPSLPVIVKRYCSSAELSQ